MTPSPARSSALTVRPEWIDRNGHLNLAYYHVLFDMGADQQLGTLGVDEAYVAKRRMTTFVAESHVVYVRELHEAASVFVTTRIVDFDAKRMHIYQELHHADGWLAATVEALVLSIDLGGPKVAPWPDDILSAITAASALEAGLPIPERLGRRVGIPKRPARRISPPASP